MRQVGPGKREISRTNIPARTRSPAASADLRRACRMPGRHGRRSVVDQGSAGVQQTQELMYLSADQQALSRQMDADQPDLVTVVVVEQGVSGKLTELGASDGLLSRSR